MKRLLIIILILLVGCTNGGTMLNRDSNEPIVIEKTEGLLNEAILEESVAEEIVEEKIVEVVVEDVVKEEVVEEVIKEVVDDAPVDEEIVNDVLVDDGQSDEASIEEENKVVDELPEEVVGAKYVVNEILIESLVVDRLTLTPGEKLTTSFGITYTLTSDMPSSVLLSLDGILIKEYEVISEKITVEEDVRHVYKAMIKGLKSETVYEFWIKQGETISSKYVFKTLGEDINLGFFGDIQGYKLSQYENFVTNYVLASKHSGPFDLNFLAGDLVDDGISINQWEYFHNTLGPYKDAQLWMSAIGNHDNYHSDVLYRKSFNYPDNGGSGIVERSYYLDHDNVRIAAWDTEASSTFDEQGNWLREVMSEAKGFKIVVMHRGLYPMSYDEGHIRVLYSLFDELEIDLVLSGHDHIYSRTTMKDDKRVDVGEGTTYIIGGSPSGSKYYDAQDVKSRYWTDVVFDVNLPVYTTIKITKDTMDVHAFSIDGEVIEQIDGLIIQLK